MYVGMDSACGSQMRLGQGAAFAQLRLSYTYFLVCSSTFSVIPRAMHHPEYTQAVRKPTKPAFLGSVLLEASDQTGHQYFFP